MIAKYERFPWILFAGVLVILFLLSSTDLIIKEKKTVVYPISVIINDTSDDYYTNFRKGADQAADDYHVDISFLTLYEKYDSVQQMELLKREIHDGAGAVILMPVQPATFIKDLDAIALNSPLVIIGTMFSHEAVKSAISIDYQEAGRKLGEAVKARHEPDTPVILLAEGMEFSYNQEICEGFKLVLEDEGFDIALYSRKTDHTIQDIIKAAVHTRGKKPVLAALDLASLQEASDIISGNSSFRSSLLSLYGVGSTTKLLNKLDQGIIKGLVVSNQFEEGYLSVEKAVEAINNHSGAEQISLESYYIEKNDLRQFEKILYPIE